MVIVWAVQYLQWLIVFISHVFKRVTQPDGSFVCLLEDWIFYFNFLSLDFNFLCLRVLKSDGIALYRSMAAFICDLLLLTDLIPPFMYTFPVLLFGKLSLSMICWGFLFSMILWICEKLDFTNSCRGSWIFSFLQIAEVLLNPSMLVSIARLTRIISVHALWIICWDWPRTSWDPYMAIGLTLTEHGIIFRKIFDTYIKTCL